MNLMRKLGVTTFAVYFMDLSVMGTVVHCPDPPKGHEWWPLLLTALFQEVLFLEWQECPQQPKAIITKGTPFQIHSYSLNT